MSLRPYPAYKYSGVAWLGEVPQHWQIQRLKVGFEVNASNVDKKSHDGQKAIKLCNYTDVYYNDYITSALDFMEATATDEQIEKFALRAGDVIITKDSETADDIAIPAYVPEDMGGVICGYHLSVIRPKKENNGLFLKYLFECYYLKACWKVLANGLTRVSLGKSALENVLLPIPNSTDQAAIAKFLQIEIGKIDALIADQENLIALLAEKRQATISHAVTKGLNPEAPMKESGVHWLGKIPAHWSISKMKYLCEKVVDCLHTTPTYEGHLEYPAIRTADVEPGKLLLEQARLVSKEVYQERVQRLVPMAGDILYSREGERFGMAALVPLGTQLCLGQRMMIFRIVNSANSGFVMWSLNSIGTLQQVHMLVGGSTSPHINISDVINFQIAEPPLVEQEKIFTFLESENNKFDKLTLEANRAIGLLKERRAALISAAVTGKIDVRGYRSEKEAA